MKQTLIEAPRRAILEYLKKKHYEEKPFPHVTELIYCLTKAYWNRTNYLEITDDQVCVFGVGHIFQDMMLPKVEVKGCCEGIYWSADQVSLVPTNAALTEHAGGMVIFDMGQKVVGELKTTRLSSKKGQDDWPGGWYKQTMAYCYANKTNTVHLISFHFMGDYSYPMTAEKMLPPVKQWEFTDEEIRSNWNWMLMRKTLLTKLIKLKRVPNPTAFCEPWECPLMGKKGMCRYELFCRARKEELRKPTASHKEVMDYLESTTTLDGDVHLLGL